MLKLCKKYMPETKEAKKARLLEMAQQKKVQLLRWDNGVWSLGRVFSYTSKYLRFFVRYSSNSYLWFTDSGWNLDCFNGETALAFDPLDFDF